MLDPVLGIEQLNDKESLCKYGPKSGFQYDRYYIASRRIRSRR